MAIAAVVAGNRIVISDLNAFYNLFKGVTGSGENITLIHNAAASLIFQPSSDPAADTQVVQVKNNAGIVQSALTFDGNAIFKTYVMLGSAATAATAGAIRGPAVLQIIARNAAGNNNVGVIQAVNDAITIGSSLVTSYTFAAAAGVVVGGSFLSVGTTPAASGAVRLPYQQSVMSRNSTNNGDESLVRYNGSTIEMGAAGSSGVKTFGPLLIGNLPAFASGDKYLIVDASGNVHVSALGPAS